MVSVQNLEERRKSLTLLHLVVADYRGVVRTWSNITMEHCLKKILNGFKLLTILAKKTPSQIFDWVENKLLAKRLKY